MNQVFSQWETNTTTELKALQPGHHPKEVIHTISEALLATYAGKALIDKYDVYQHLMNYWFDVMQDDCYLIAAPEDSGGGWKAETYRIIETNKKGKEVDKGWTCDLIPKPLVIDRYFAEEQQAINDLESRQENLESQLTELEEEHGGEEGALSSVANKTDANIALNEYMDLAWSSINPATFSEYKRNAEELETKLTRHLEMKELQSIGSLKNNKGNITQKAIKDRLKQQVDIEEEALLNQYLDVDKTIKEIKKSIKELREKAIVDIDKRIASKAEDEYLEEIVITRQYLQLTQEIADIKKTIKEAKAKLDAALLDFYPTLTEEQIKQLVVDDKWMATIDKDIHTEMDRISQRLTQRIKELAERYETPLPQQNQNVIDLEKVVNDHLQKMGFVWN
jgi:type I restriction enzyme M protein